MKKLIVLLILCMAVPAFAVKDIPNGSTSQSISVVIQDSSGDPNTGVTISDLDLYVQKDGAGAQSAKIDLVALATADTAWTSGRAIHKGNGVYRIDIPDANLSDGAGTLLTYIIDDAGTSNDTAFYEVQLTDAAQFTGLTTLLARIYETLGLSEIGDKVWADEPNATSIQAILVDTSTTIPGQITDSNSYTTARLGDILTDTALWDTAAEARTILWGNATALRVDSTSGAVIDANDLQFAPHGETVTASLDAASVDAIWDELMSGHTTVGSAAAYVRSAAYDNRK